MDTADPGPVGAALGTASTVHLVRAAAALRWHRPDLTTTLAELALEAAADVTTWIAAAGWLLHGRAALGDGRDAAGDLLDGLDRWGDAAAGPMAGPAGRRLRVELAGPARRIGQPDTARALLAADAGADDGDAELRADVLTELARCAADDAPETVDDALRAAEQAWRVAACPPGLASVKLLAAARQRQKGCADEAVAQAVDGLRHVTGGSRRAGATVADHVAAGLTAEWIAALTEAGRLDEARGEALPAARRLLGSARPSRQVAGLRLALARVTAVADSPEAVLAGLEAAAQDATDSDVPELESACRAMLGELHENAGRLDVALTALRASMAAERRDRDRASRLRARLAATAATWGARPGGGPARVLAGAAPPTGRPDQPVASAIDRAEGPAWHRGAADDGPVDTAESAAPPRGRRARRAAAEVPHRDDSRRDATRPGPPPLDGVTRPRARDADAAPFDRWTGTCGGSLIGDALLRELGSGAGAPGPGVARVDGATRRGDHRRPAAGDAPGLGGSAPDHGGPAPDGVSDPDGRSSADDTVVLGVAREDTPTASADGARPESRRRRVDGRPPSADVDGLGLAELLAGALAAYRNL